MDNHQVWFGSSSLYIFPIFILWKETYGIISLVNTLGAAILTALIVASVCAPCTRRHGVSAACTWGLRRGRGSAVSKDEILRLQHRINELESERQYVISQSRSPGVGAPRNNALQLETDNSKVTKAMMGLMEEGRSEFDIPFQRLKCHQFHEPNKKRH